MPLLLHTFGDVPKRMVKTIAAFAHVAQTVADVRHRVTVRLIATDKFFSEGEKSGLFYYGPQTAEIWLATLADLTADEMCLVLCHELRHYQCWRDRELQWEIEDDADAKGEEIYRIVKRGTR